ncbi:hypothetical protein FOCC_FOCC002453 [Frankliniella occidentalis]|nr:hypothetical protein FOCC_FOCC002453 [Frankliniella occidentalis]
MRQVSVLTSLPPRTMNFNARYLFVAFLVLLSIMGVQCGKGGCCKSDKAVSVISPKVIKKGSSSGSGPALPRTTAFGQLPKIPKPKPT